MEVAPVGVLSRSVLATSRGVAREICNQQRTSKLQQVYHHRDRRSEIGDIDGVRLEPQAAPAVPDGSRHLDRRASVSSSCHVGSGSYGGHSGILQRPAKAAFSTPYVQRLSKPSVCNAAEHDGIENTLSPPIATLSDGFDLCLCRAVAPIIHDPIPSKNLVTMTAANRGDVFLERFRRRQSVRATPHAHSCVVSKCGLLRHPIGFR